MNFSLKNRVNHSDHRQLDLREMHKGESRRFTENSRANPLVDPNVPAVFKINKNMTGSGIKSRKSNNKLFEYKRSPELKVEDSSLILQNSSVGSYHTSLANKSYNFRSRKQSQNNDLDMEADVKLPEI